MTQNKELLDRLPWWLRQQAFLHVKDIDDDGYEYDRELGGDREQTDIEDANVIASREGASPFYRPVLDLDIQHWYAPSSTPGKAHLILDMPLLKSEHDELLTVLARLGIVEHGFAEAGRRSKWGAAVRLPWVKKQQAVTPEQASALQSLQDWANRIETPA